MKRTLLACAGVLALMSAAHAQTTDEKQDAQKAAQTWMDAFNKKDFATVANMYSYNGVYSNPWWTSVGPQAIEKAFKDEKRQMTVTAIKVDRADRLADVEWWYGSWSGIVKEAGKDIVMTGHWSNICRLQGDKCLSLSHVVNMELPPSPAATQ
jgi:ketosteroid isomerase-like protein